MGSQVLVFRFYKKVLCFITDGLIKIPKTYNKDKTDLQFSKPESARQKTRLFLTGINFILVENYPSLSTIYKTEFH